jgi:hypothetical protein
MWTVVSRGVALTMSSARMAPVTSDSNTVCSSSTPRCSFLVSPITPPHVATAAAPTPPSYVSDYIAKLGLKTYQAFASVFDVFERNAENLKCGANGVETSRTLMRQMINSMSTKMEIGSPMAAMYLLGNPDHYPGHQYVNFVWRSYVVLL